MVETHVLQENLSVIFVVLINIAEIIKNETLGTGFVCLTFFDDFCHFLVIGMDKLVNPLLLFFHP